MPCRWPLVKARYLGGLSTLAWHGVFSPTSVEHHGGHKCSHLCQPFASLKYQCFHGNAIGWCNGFTVTCAGRCIPSLDPCRRSLLSTLLGDVLSLAIGKSLLPGWFEQSGIAWCFLSHQARSTRDDINIRIGVSLSQVSALHRLGMSKIGYFFWHFMLLALLLLSLNNAQNYALFAGKCQKC